MNKRKTADITLQQKEIIKDLRNHFYKINAIEYQVTDLITTIDAALKKRERNKLRQASMKNIAHNKALGGLTKYYEQIVLPLVNKYIPKAKRSISHAGIRIESGTCYSDFVINSVFHYNHNGEFEEITFKHYRHPIRNLTSDSDNLSDVFNPILTDFILNSI